jgi:hypothetical protein
MAETVLAEAEGLQGSWELGDEIAASTGLTPLPRIQPEWYQTSWYVGDDLLAHVAEGAWITVRARSSEALIAFTGDDTELEN